MNDEAGSTTSETRAFPSFRTLTHPDVLSSLILEISLDTIYNFLFGPNGCRAVSLFRSTASVVASPTLHTGAQDEEFLATVVTTCLSAPERIVQLNQGAQVVVEFTAIMNNFNANIPGYFLEAGSRSLIRIQQRQGIGATIRYHVMIYDLYYLCSLEIFLKYR